MNNTHFEKPTINRSRIRGVIFLVAIVVFYYIFQDVYKRQGLSFWLGSW